MKNAYEIYAKELEGIREAGMYKDERIITTEQRARIDTTTTHGRSFCRLRKPCARITRKNFPLLTCWPMPT